MLSLPLLCCGLRFLLFSLQLLRFWNYQGMKFAVIKVKFDK